MCLEAPQVLEVLARPEQPERCVHCRLVAAARGVAYAGEEPAAALGVAEVWWRHLASLDERGSERGVPRLQGLEFAVEVAGTALEMRVRVRHAPECAERLRCAANTRRAADERRDILDIELRRGALGEVLPKRIVEAAKRGIRGAAGVGGLVGPPFTQPASGCDHVLRAARIRGCKLV